MPVAAIPNSLAEFQCRLLGTWENAAFPDGTGGPDNPYSYCVMPLPQDPPGYILKNFKLTEMVEFEGDAAVSSPATAPNRGNTDLQVPTAVFYEQNVSFALVPNVSGIVHVENGAWLNLLRADKLTGPYPPPPGSGIKNLTSSGQPADTTIAKQMSVPHGNSILALGKFDAPAAGVPSIPDSASTLPTPLDGGPALDTTVYTDPTSSQQDQNPFPELTQNPNKSLQDGIAALHHNSTEVTNYIHWSVSTDPNGSTMNIPFEQGADDILDYTAGYWLLSTDGGGTYVYLAYFQRMDMRFKVGNFHYRFPHVTTNVVTKTGSDQAPDENCAGMQEAQSLRDRAADLFRRGAERGADMIDDD